MGRAAGLWMLAAALLLPGALHAQVGEMTVLEGQATVYRGERAIAVKRALVLESEDRIKTGPGSKVHLRFHAPLAGAEMVATADTEFRVKELKRRDESNPIALVFGALRARIASFSSRATFTQTPTATIGIKGTDFITYVKRRNATEFIGVEGLIEAASRSRRDYSLRIGQRQWGEIVEGEKPKDPVSVPDEAWFPALREFSFPGEGSPAR
jgi:hypothetical protein